MKFCIALLVGWFDDNRSSSSDAPSTFKMHIKCQRVQMCVCFFLLFTSIVSRLLLSYHVYTNAHKMLIEHTRARLFHMV